jgi:hypothetical protein
MQPYLQQLLPVIIATSFAAGINIYATVLTLGLLAHAGLVALPPTLSLLDSWWMIGMSGALFFVEIFADKIPYFDVIWNSLHTFVRIPAAALLAYEAGSRLPPQWQLAASALGAAIAFTAHTGKTALRLGVNATPEPFTNFMVSTAEDGAAVGLTWLATVHPYAAAAMAILCMLALVFAIRLILRGLRRGLALLRQQARKA